jgi:hypothetical protein
VNTKLKRKVEKWKVNLEEVVVVEIAGKVSVGFPHAKKPLGQNFQRCCRRRRRRKRRVAKRRVRGTNDDEEETRGG